MGGEGSSAKPVIHFVLIHGASHGAWCWYKLTTLLETAGFKVTSVDLTGAGISLVDSNTVLNSDLYNRPLFSLLSDLPSYHRVILVGHSVGGGSVTQALCKFTNKISMVVYLAAAMVRPGSRRSPHLSNMHVGEGKDIWDYTYGEGTDKPPTGVVMKQQFIRQYYYNQSPLEDVSLASKLLRPAPMRAFQDLDKLPPNAEAEKVPRVYIKTGKDNMFDSMEQDLLVKNWPPSQLYVLEESDHSAFFSVPTTLFAYLVRAVSKLKLEGFEFDHGM